MSSKHKIQQDIKVDMVYIYNPSLLKEIQQLAKFRGEVKIINNTREIGDYLAKDIQHIIKQKKLIDYHLASIMINLYQVSCHLMKGNSSVLLIINANKHHDGEISILKSLLKNVNFDFYVKQ